MIRHEMMKQRTRTTQWCEKKILQVLSKKCQVVTYLALAAHVLENVQSLEEDRNCHRALGNLLSRGVVRQERTEDKFALFRLVT
jgi:chaperonin cofactor prefoldin